MPKVIRQTPKPAPPKLTSQDSRNGWDLISSLHMLVYGVSGSGKTTFASTFPDPILWLICSGGSKPGELKSIDTPANRRRITPRVINSVEEYEGELEKAEAYATVVLDHATGFADLRLKEILGLAELPAQKGWGMATNQQYGQLSLQCKESFRSLLNLNSNVVITAQERVFGGKEDGGDPEIIRPTVGAALTPSLAGWLYPACDYVVQTFKRPKYISKSTSVGGKTVVTQQRGKGVEYCVRTGPHDIYTTKFRLPKGQELPDCLVDASYDKVMALINGAG